MNSQLEDLKQKFSDGVISLEELIQEIYTFGKSNGYLNYALQMKDMMINRYSNVDSVYTQSAILGEIAREVNHTIDDICGDGKYVIEKRNKRVFQQIS